MQNLDDLEDVPESPSAMHRELKGIIEQYILNETRDLYKGNYEAYKTAQRAIDKANTEQLWSLYKLTKRGTKFKVLYCSDFLAVTFAGIFVGIEKDGYTHS